MDIRHQAICYMAARYIAMGCMAGRRTEIDALPATCPGGHQPRREPKRAGVTPWDAVSESAERRAGGGPLRDLG